MDAPFLSDSTALAALPATLDGWALLAQNRDGFDFWGRALDDSEKTRARFDGLTLTLTHWVSHRMVASMALRRSPDGSWRCMISPCLISIMGSAAPEEMAWAQLGEAFLKMPPTSQISLGAKAAHALLSLLSVHG